ncbi:MAG: hypothetical protein AB1420_06910 [Bacillota bacterium]
MGDKGQTRLIWVMAFFIFALSWLNYTNTKELQNRVAQLQSEIGNIRWQVSNEVSRIESVVTQMKEEERWWTPAELQVLSMDKDLAVVKIAWQLKDYQAGSEVKLNYREGRAGDYKAVAASDQGNGYFSVELPLALKQEPQLTMHVSRLGSSGNVKSTGRSQSVEVAVEETSEFSADFHYHYYISVDDRGTIRTSEVRTLDLQKLSYGMFNHASVFIGIEKDKIEGRLHEMIDQEPGPLYTLQEVFLETKLGADQLVERWSFDKATQQDKRSNIYEVRAVPTQSYDSLFLVLRYSEGLTVERKIPAR